MSADKDRTTAATPGALDLLCAAIDRIGDEAARSELREILAALSDQDAADAAAMVAGFDFMRDLEEARP